MKKSFYIFLVIIIIGFIASLYMAYKRISIEKDLNTVDLVMDYDDWDKFCLQNGYELEKSLPKLKELEISSFGVYEDTCKRLAARGELSVLQGFDIIQAARLTQIYNPILQDMIVENNISPEKTYIIFSHKTPYIDIIQKYFTRYYGTERVKVFQKPISEYSVIEVSGDYNEIVALGVGFPEDITKMLSQYGFSIVPRMENRKLNPECLNFIFQELSNIPKCSVIIFSGMYNEVLGYPDLLEETSEQIKNKGLYFGYIEVADLANLQKGAITIARSDITRVVRVLSLTQAYQAKLKLEQMLDIWSLAVRERNIRLLYLRPILEPIEDKSPIDGNFYYISLCRDELVKFGYKMGPSKGMKDMECPLIISILLGLGIISAFILVLSRIFQLNFSYCWILFFISLLIEIPGLLFFNSLFSKLMALSGSIIFLVFAFVYGFPGLFGTQISPQKNNILFALKHLWALSLITVIGSLITMGLLSSTLFFLTVERFRGVKIIMVIPVFLVLFVYIYSQIKGDKFTGVYSRVKAFFAYPLYLWQFIGLLIVLTLGVFYIMRSGNDPSIPVSELEKNFRTFLDEILVVRPRFKDFLMGHPALFLLAYLWKSGKKEYIGILIVLSVIGQANLLDTFAHLHTPLLVSIIRIFNGLWIGSFIGIIIIFCYNFVAREFKKRGF